jgi:hypothetical protein
MCWPLSEFHVDDVEEPQLETANAANQMSKGNVNKFIVD